MCAAISCNLGAFAGGSKAAWYVFGFLVSGDVVIIYKMVVINGFDLKLQFSVSRCYVVAVDELTRTLGFSNAGHNYIDTEHLLLGLLQEGEGVAAQVPENLGVDLSNICTQVWDLPLTGFILKRR